MFFRYLLTFAAIGCFHIAMAQKVLPKYEKEWKIIDSLISKKGLTQSALSEVNKLYDKAKKSNNGAQQIKSLLYRLQLQNIKEEDASLKNIKQLEKEILQAKDAVKAILQTILADQYWHYFEDERDLLYDRTEIILYKKTDITTWSSADFHKKIAQLYKASLKNEVLLKQTPLEPFEAIIEKGNSRNLRPTLFDLLTHHALKYFINDEQDIDKPAYSYEITEPAAFGTAEEFIKEKFSTKDTLSLHHEALLLYQKLIAFHLEDKNPAALVDVDVSRLQFVKQYAVTDQKEFLYKEALSKIAERYRNQPAGNYALLLLAKWYFDTIAENTSEQKDGYVKAKEICEQILAAKDSGNYTVPAKQLLQSITQQQLRLQTEKVNLPGIPFRALISYRNTSKIFIRVLALDKKTKELLSTKNSWENEYWQLLKQVPFKAAYEQELPVTKDYLEHSVEIKVDALPVGEYALFTSVNSNFNIADNCLATQFFYVSALSWLKNGNDFYVVNRETGYPLPKTNVQVWYRYFDRQQSKYQQRKGENLVTDKNGFFHLEESRTNTNNSFRIELSREGDYLFLNDENYNAYSRGADQPENTSYKSFLFTDRSIYRPGQILYFKGILISQNNKTANNKVADNKETTLYLFDPNGEKVDSLVLKTNEFGSYSGKFTLPRTQVTGQFQLQDKVGNNSVFFSVEEYKRPKFSVSIKKPEGTYALNDTLVVKGMATSYAGENINGALVRYRVVRKTILPIWNDYFRGKIAYPFRRSEMEIAHGETKTSSNGVFEISFKAIADASIDKKDQPVFHYEITADITDMSGETRSGNTSVAVAYQALKLNIQTPEQLPSDSLKELIISTTNINEVFEKTTVTISIHKLTKPNRQFRSRYWGMPDQFLLKEEEYHQLFPFDIYKDENIVSNWKREKTITSFAATTVESGRISLSNQLLSPGWYLIEVSAIDKNGEPIKALKAIELTGIENTNPMAFGNLILAKDHLAPGDKLAYTVRTNFDSLWIIHHINRANKIPEQKFLPVNKETSNYTAETSEADRGGIALDISFIKNNRVYTDNAFVTIPFTNKELSINYASYRDKTLPGSEEKWKVHIKGYQADKVIAEMLTTMYDASLDQFQPHSLSIPSIWNIYVAPQILRGDNGFGMGETVIHEMDLEEYESVAVNYDELKYDFIFNENGLGRIGTFHQSLPSVLMLEKSEMDSDKRFVGKAAGLSVNDEEAPPSIETKKPETVEPLQIRKNFNETAFFFPDLKTDSNGDIEFSFTIPEALTTWKWMSLAHTKELAFGYAEKSIITQKDLMVQANAPRFFREGDRMDFTAKIVNLTDKELTGQVELQLIDPSTNQPVDGWFRNFFPNQYFTVPAKLSVPASFTIEIPFQYNKPVIYRLIARSGQKSDGEEMTIPVISNRTLVTESIPLNILGTGSKTFRFEKLLQSAASETLTHQSFTVEMTSNPAWYAVQALPYLMEFPYECAEQNFNRYYSNALAAYIVKSSPRIRKVMEAWKAAGSKALESPLTKNPELKALLLEETPWVLEAKDEATQRKNIALLFDEEKLSREMNSWLDKLAEMQIGNGAFPWFKDGPDDQYITQYIISGLGHLKKLQALPANNGKLQAITAKGISYLDNKMKESYDKLVKQKANLTTYQTGTAQIQYLYMRSFFPELNIPGEIFKAYNFYRSQVKTNWIKESRYMQGMISLALFRSGEIQIANDIVKSLQQNAITNEELGMYWKEFNTGGYYWYQSPIESHSLLIEAFAEIKKDNKITDNLKTWLLKQKQTNNWRTTKATAEACYALLLTGSNWLNNESTVNIKAGNIDMSASATETEAGTGYFKKSIEGSKVMSGNGNITVTVTAPPPSPSGEGLGMRWGAAYWQYFEDLDKITPAATPLKLSKQLFIEKNTDRGTVLEPLTEEKVLHIGDKVIVRIEIRTDRNMEYVHMKDMRAASFEPVNVLSSYKWKGGLGYYESTRDAATNFFFSYIPRGTYVFEYPMFVTHTGTFSNGITSIQCMYAPEFTAHSEGVKVRVE